MANDLNRPGGALLKVHPIWPGNLNLWFLRKRLCSLSLGRRELTSTRSTNTGAAVESGQTAGTGARADTLYIVCEMPHLVALLPPKWAFGNGPNLFLRIAKIFLRPFSFASGSIRA
jgi:hypothetical protein